MTAGRIRESFEKRMVFFFATEADLPEPEITGNALAVIGGTQLALCDGSEWRIQTAITAADPATISTAVIPATNANRPNLTENFKFSSIIRNIKNPNTINT